MKNSQIIISISLPEYIDKTKCIVKFINHKTPIECGKKHKVAMSILNMFNNDKKFITKKEIIKIFPNISLSTIERSIRDLKKCGSIIQRRV